MLIFCWKIFYLWRIASKDEIYATVAYSLSLCGIIKMKTTSFLILLILFQSFSSNECDDLVLKKMFKTGIKNQSTAPTYLVIEVVDGKTKEKKEICCESIILSYVIEKESGASTNNITFNDKCIPTFVFNNKNSLESLNFSSYKNEVVDSIKRFTPKTLIDSILQENRIENYSKLLENQTTKYRNPYFEHFLFLNHILTKRDCESGFTIIEQVY